MRKTSVLIVLLLPLLVFPAQIVAAQPTTDLSVCEYQETRNPVPINPKTNKPYTPDERNQETFAEASISKHEIRQCLKAKTPIKNHHIVFEDYRDAWQELAKETGDYAIPLLITGGVLHASIPFGEYYNLAYRANIIQGGINFWGFRDPNVNDASKLTEEERKTFGIEKMDELIALIRSRIEWTFVFIDSAVSVVIVGNEDTHPRDDTSSFIFGDITNFSRSSFSGDTSFRRVSFSGDTDFSETSFSEKTEFYRASFSGGISFWSASFSGDTDFSETSFSEKTYFNIVSFSGETSFAAASFSGETSFAGVSFSGGTSFFRASFSGGTSFFRASFSETTYFSGVSFSGGTSFVEASFPETTYFSGVSFSGGTIFWRASFSGGTDFGEASFSGGTSFFRASFSGETSFVVASFSGETSFSEASFSGETSFSDAIFKGNCDFRSILVSEKLTFDNTSWEKRADFRGMSVKELSWDSTNNPSNVQGVIDMREAYIGSAVVKEVRFQDLVDISRTNFGRYRTDSAKLFDDLELMNTDFIDLLGTDVFVAPSAQFRLENNTFEQEADFLHVKFNAPTVFINNRFRRTLDLTGAKFEAQNSQVQNSRLCLSYNRINRLVFEPEHLGNPPGIYPHHQFASLKTNPLQTSRVRRIGAPECTVTDQTTSNPTNTTRDTQDEEALDDIYKTLGKSFSEANDRAGINEAWYLETLAKREQDSTIWADLSWFFLDVPSRYSVDVWRTVWISVFIMLCFYPLYALEFWRIARANQRNLSVPPLVMQTTGYPRHERAFRFRIFESFLAKDNQAARRIIPLWDGAMLSIRTYLKLGLGTTYPTSKPLKIITGLEWALGVFMLVHFLLAIRSNLPFLLPFLGLGN
jgi:Pentapeptide repeats (9 copies)